MASDNIKENIKNTNSWIRFLFIIIFLAFYGIAEVIFWFAVVVQVLFTLLTGSTNRNIKVLSGKVAEYIYAVLRYVSYHTEEKPFPFSPWPHYEEQEDDDLPLEPEKKQTAETEKSSSDKQEEKTEDQEG